MTTIPNIRKNVEFEAFLDTLETGSIGHWSDIAEALGVNKDTITEWRKHPKAIKAHSSALQYALASMEKAGRNDWRMWEAKLRMLGIKADKKDAINNDRPPHSLVVFTPKKLVE